MKLTYAQLLAMMGVINEMIQAKPGPVVEVTSVLGVNANRIESVLKGYKIAYDAIQGELKTKVPCTQVKIAESELRGHIESLVLAMHEDPKQWDTLTSVGFPAMALKPLWFQRGDLNLKEEYLEEIWETKTPAVLGPFEINNSRYAAVQVLAHQDQEVVPSELKEAFEERIAELDDTEIEVKIWAVKVSGLVRSEKTRPGYATDATWFYRAPEMFLLLEDSCPSEEED